MSLRPRRVGNKTTSASASPPTSSGATPGLKPTNVDFSKLGINVGSPASSSTDPLLPSPESQEFPDAMDVDNGGGGGDGDDGGEFFFLEVFQGDPKNDPGCSYKNINPSETGYVLRVSVTRFKDWSKRTFLAKNILGRFNEALAKDGDDFKRGIMEQPYDCSNPKVGDIHVYFVKKDAESPMLAQISQLFQLLYMDGTVAIPFPSPGGPEFYLQEDMTGQPQSVMVIKYVKQ